MPSWAIIVGINRYPPLAQQPRLQGAVADACDFADWALDPQGGNVAPDRMFLWTYPWPTQASNRLQSFLAAPQPLWDNEATDWAAPRKTRPPRAMEIVQTAQRVGRTAFEAAFVAGDDEPRRIYVFLAGHGLRAKEIGNNSEQTCFVAGDFRPLSSNNVQGLVACESLRKALLTDRFNEAIVFLDCCRLKTSRLAMTAMAITDYSNDPVGVSWGVGNAAQDGAVAYETIGAPVRGAFTKTLTEGLRTCRDDATNELHVERLSKFVQDNIGSHTAAGQSPSFLYVPNPPGPVIVSGAVAPAQVKPPSPGPAVRMANLPAGTQVVLKDGNNIPVAGVGPLVAGAAPVVLPLLADGLYSLEVVGQPDRIVIFKQPRVDPVDVL